MLNDQKMEMSKQLGTTGKFSTLAVIESSEGKESKCKMMCRASEQN